MKLTKITLAIAGLISTSLALLPQIKLLPIDEVTSVSYNPLLTSWLQAKGANIFEVESVDTLTPQALLRHGVIKVRQTKSIIMNDVLAERAVSESYVPSLTSQKARFSRGSTNFTEVSYLDAKFKKSMTDWMGMGPCRKSENNATGSFSQGWSISSNSDNTLAISVPLYILSESFTLKTTLHNSYAGGVSCNIPSYGKLQFQMMAETTTAAHVKSRQIRVVNGLWSSKLEFGEYEEMDEYEEVNRENLQVACVTDPRYMMCD